MSKLFNLKKWLTVGDAARHLSIVFGEEVSEADVLRLALDGHLKLSVNFVNKAKAKCGKVVGYDDAEWGEIPAELAATLPNIPDEAKGKPLPYMKSLNIDRERFLNLGDDVTTIDGVWDLPMIGNERLDVEHEYQNLTGGPAVTLQGLDGAFVEGQDGQLCQLQDSFEPREIETPQGTKKVEGSYYPAGGLPRDSVLVVRVGALIDLQERISSEDSAKEKPLGIRPETTYQNIIGGLLGLMLGKTPAGKSQSVFENQTAIISAMLAHYGSKPGISERTLEEKFAAANQSLRAT